MKFLVILLSLFFAVSAAADQAVLGVPDGSGCFLYTLCSAQTVAGVCDSVGDTTGEALVASVGNEYTWSVWADTSVSTSAWTVTLHDKTPGAGYGTVNAQLNSSNIIPANPKFSWNGIGGDTFAIAGGTLTGGITVIAKGCPLVD